MSPPSARSSSRNSSNPATTAGASAAHRARLVEYERDMESVALGPMLMGMLRISHRSSFRIRRALRSLAGARVLTPSRSRDRRRGSRRPRAPGPRRGPGSSPPRHERWPRQALRPRPDRLLARRPPREALAASAAAYRSTHATPVEMYEGAAIAARSSRGCVSRNSSGIRVPPPEARCRPEGRRAVPWPRPDAAFPSPAPPRPSTPGRAPPPRGRLHAGTEPGTSPEAECRLACSWCSRLRKCRRTHELVKQPVRPLPVGESLRRVHGIFTDETRSKRSSGRRASGSRIGPAGAAAPRDPWPAGRRRAGSCRARTAPDGAAPARPPTGGCCAARP